MAATRVKICGICRAADATRAVELGASAIGFVFWPGSPRYIAPPEAREIAARLPAHVTAIGVFVDQPAKYVAEVAELVPLGAVQLHGTESIEAFAELNSEDRSAPSTSGARNRRVSRFSGWRSL